MIESRIEELFYSIENSKVYQEYKKMKDILDKDSEIKELIDDTSKVLLFPRPRRFGKTLNMSMINYYLND